MSKSFYIGDWQVQPSAGLISRNNETCRLEPKVMAVLEVLAAAEGAAVTRADIMDAVWPKQDISDEMLTSTVSTLRRALGDDRHENCYIQTLPKRGYRVVAKVRAVEPPLSATPSSKVLPTAVSADKPEGVASAKPGLAWSILAVVVLIVLGAWYWTTQQTSPVPMHPDTPSIAVLPLEVFSNDPEMEHFASGLEEELIHQLARQPGLRVIARTSSSQFREQNLGIREIGQTLGVQHVIEGSVRDNSGGIRITIQLINAGTDSHLWSHVFDVAKNRLVAVQEEVGMTVSRMIYGQQEVARSVQQPRHPVPDSAYRLFLLGEAHMRVGTAESYRKASGYFSDAVHISPNYALAYSRLAATFLLLYQYGGEPLEQAVNSARKALDTALRLDPDQAEALATMGLMYTYEKDYVEAERYFKAALERQGNLRFSLHNYGFMLWSQSRFDEALVPLQKALDIDPLSGVTNFLVGDALVGARAFAPARAHYEKCQSLLPEYYACPAGLASLQMLTAELDQAQKTLTHAGTLVSEDHFWQLLGEANLALQHRNFAAVKELLDRATPQNPRDYVLLRLKLLHSLATKQLPVFVSELQELLANHPSDRDVRLIAALSFYFSGSCPAAIDIYEQEMKQADAFLVDVWDLSFGISHAESLAYCYEVSGNIEAKDELLVLINDYLSTASSPLLEGEWYLRAKQSYLLKNIAEGNNYLTKLESENWPMTWLAADDPVIIRATQSNPAQ